MTHQGAIITAYRSLATGPDSWVTLTRLRERLSHISRPAVDTALAELFHDGWIELIAEVNQATLTPADRAAALHIAGDTKHLLRAR